MRHVVCDRRRRPGLAEAPAEIDIVPSGQVLAGDVVDRVRLQRTKALRLVPADRLKAVQGLFVDRVAKSSIVGCSPRQFKSARSRELLVALLDPCGGGASIEGFGLAMAAAIAHDATCAIWATVPSRLARSTIVPIYNIAAALVTSGVIGIRNSR